MKRIVLQSSQAVGTRPGAASHAPLHAIEDQVRQSGLGWTILRRGRFASNAFAWADPVRSGRAILGAPTGHEQRISPDVTQMLGRPPQPFAEWAARNIDAFR